MRYHPIHLNQYRDEYVALGEAKFLKMYEGYAHDYLDAHKQAVRPRILSRAVNAFIYLKSPTDVYALYYDPFTQGDRAKLLGSGIIGLDRLGGDLFWNSLHLTPVAFQQQIDALHLQQPHIAISSWTVRKQEYEEKLHSFPRMVAAGSVAGIPALCLLLGLVTRAGRKDPMFRVAAVLYFLYLTPYVLASHYSRYQLPLVGLQSIFVFFTAGWFFSCTDAFSVAAWFGRPVAARQMRITPPLSPARIAAKIDFSPRRRRSA